MLIIAIMLTMRIVIYEVNYHNYKYYIHYCYYAYYVVVSCMFAVLRSAAVQRLPHRILQVIQTISCICKLLCIVLLLSIHALIPASPVSCANFTTDFCVLVLFLFPTISRLKTSGRTFRLPSMSP